MLAEITALFFSFVALALSTWLYVSSVDNRADVVRTQKMEAKAEALRAQLGVLKKSLQDQQEKITAAPAPEKGRPPIVSDAVTVADWNNNAKLKDLLAKHGYISGSAASRGK
jgi:hypothetical protein